MVPPVYVDLEAEVVLRGGTEELEEDLRQRFSTWLAFLQNRRAEQSPTPEQPRAYVRSSRRTGGDWEAPPRNRCGVV